MSKPVALVTGATRGIGRSIAEALAPEFEIAVGGRSADAVAEVCEALPDALPFVADLADSASIEKAMDALDRVDVVVHSAGVLGGTDVDETPREEWRRVFETNVFAVAELTRLALPKLRASSFDRRTIVIINSGAGFTAGPGSSVYAASKFAVRALADSLRAEVRDEGIRVSSVHPGRVDTDMQHELVASENGEYDAAKYLTPEAVADAVRFAISTPAGGSVDTVALRPLG